MNNVKISKVKLLVYKAKLYKILLSECDSVFVLDTYKTVFFDCYDKVREKLLRKEVK